eukprot:CAMPEP_0197883508 /NCGR_PEP_ID=MMETSP1439-20131203/10316_1 /TAXON_ID=66791 /ORGANISM="Gonyaulax spinifera, Strain CCMP409" /LENGTH=232 /DNA_ID=CAMNT_0043503231 /DNA_START=48 /DNA_END=742 /DNA_ORIENTATION=-
MARSLQHHALGHSAQRATRGPPRRLAAVALVALAMSVVSSSWPSSRPRGAPAAFTAVLNRGELVGQVQLDGQEVARTGGAAKADEQHLKSKKAMTHNVTLLTAASMARITQSPRIAQGPPWSTCFVETEDAGLPVLEEWILRGETKNVQSFRSWRQSGAEPVSVRCEDSSVVADDSVMCIECVSHFEAPGGSGSAAVAVAQARMITTFVDLQQCQASTPGGMNFCKSGRVVV